MHEKNTIRELRPCSNPAAAPRDGRINNLVLTHILISRNATVGNSLGLKST